jgi:hypothetical protein
MPFRKSSSMDSTGIERVAQAWGKVVARRVEEQVGPQLDLDADDIEQCARGAACAVAKGTIEELLEMKAAALGPEQGSRIKIAMSRRLGKLVAIQTGTRVRRP